jgi:hypothetical protein
MSCEKIEIRLVRNCCEYSKFLNLKQKNANLNQNFKSQIWKSLNFEFETVLNFKFKKLPKFEFGIWKIAKISNVEFEKSPNVKFGKWLNFQISNLKIAEFSKVQTSNLKNHWISKLKSLTAGKSTSQGAFRIDLWKNSFSKRTWKKAGSFGLTFVFFKNKSTLKAKPNTPYVWCN